MHVVVYKTYLQIKNKLQNEISDQELMGRQRCSLGLCACAPLALSVNPPLPLVSVQVQLGAGDHTVVQAEKMYRKEY